MDKNMEIFATWTSEFRDLLSTYIVRPWTLYQLLIILGCFAIAYFVSRLIEPWFEERARKIRGNPNLLRIIVALLRRTQWILFLILLWVTHNVIIASTWQSRSYILTTALILASVWLTVTVLSRIIRNKTLARTIAICAFVYFAVGILGLREEVNQFLDSFAVNLGELRISSLLVLRIVVFTGLLLWLANVFGKLFENQIARLDDLSPSLRVLIGKVLHIGLIILALVLAISAAGIDLTAFTILSGAIGLGIGFGLQKVVSNFLSGIIILGDKSIKPGDTIELGDTVGWIRELHARYVSVITRDGREYLVPNEDFITQQVVNWSYSDNFVRLEVDFGVSYDSDPHEVTRLAIQAATRVSRVIADRQPVCWLTAFGASSLDFKLRFWIDDPKEGLTNARGEVLMSLWDTFQKSGVAIPFPHREIIVRTPIEVLNNQEGH